MVPAAFAGDDGRTSSRRAWSRATSIIDGGNSYYRDDIDRAEALEPKGIHYVDVGTSGGVFGLERGFCLMIGGEPEPVERLDPIFRTLAPGRREARRGRRAAAASPPPPSRATCTAGPPGAGHFVKMVHNGIEYGLMAAYAEGFNVLRHANVGKRGRRPRGRRDGAAARPAVLPVRHRRRRRSPRCGGAAA